MNVTILISTAATETTINARDAQFLGTAFF